MYRVLLLLLVSTAFACTPARVALRSESGQALPWEEAELRQMTYFLSQDLVIERPITGAEGEKVMGMTVERNGKPFDQITISRETPGEFLQLQRSNMLAVTFAQGDRDRYLVFSPSAKWEGACMLVVPFWSEGKAQVNYGGQVYFTVPGTGIPALEAVRRK